MMSLSFEEAKEKRRLAREEEFREYDEVANAVKFHLIELIDREMINNYDKDRFEIYFEKDADETWIKIGYNLKRISYYDFINYLFHSLREAYEAKDVGLKLFYREPYNPGFLKRMLGAKSITAAWYIQVERDYQ